MITEPLTPARTWHLVLRRKVLASGDLGAVLLAYHKLPEADRAKAKLAVGTLERRKP